MKKHKHLIIVLFLISVFGLGFAFLQTSLNISGVTSVDRHSWSVHWDTESVSLGSSSGVTLNEPYYFSDNDTVFHYDLTLEKPGDFAYADIDVVNEGTLDVMIQNISITINGLSYPEETSLPAYMDYDVSYSDGYEVESNQLLAANSSESMRLRFDFKRDIANSELPETAQSISITYRINYVQADANAIVLNKTIYTYSDKVFEIGQPIPSGADYGYDRDDIMSAFGQPFYIKHTIHGNIVQSSSIGFKHNNVIYEVPYGDEYYLSNKTLLTNVFGPTFEGRDSCQEVNNEKFECLIYNDDHLEWYAEVALNDDGYAGVLFQYTNISCGIVDDKSVCADSLSFRSNIGI